MLWYLIYNFFMMMVSPILIVALGIRKKYRTGFLQRIGFIPRTIRRQLNGARPIWLHAVSVGEVTASIPIIKKIREEHPEVPIVLSTITATGNYTARSKVHEADFIIYFPYDYFFVVGRVIGIINPRIFIHTETEIWPNFLWALERRGIPSVIVNGRISSESSRRYKLFGRFFKNVFNKVSVFGMQSAIDCRRALDIGADAQKVLLTGNMKFDQKLSGLLSEEKLKHLRELNLSSESEILIAGSTHAGEETIVLEVFSQLLPEYPRLMLILAPRHPERFQEVEKIVREKGFAVIRRTQIGKDNLPEQVQVILLDTIGELSLTYGIGDVIFVGGSLVNIGGHNILEPLVYRKPVLFGPYMHNFTEIGQVLVESGAGIQVRNQRELSFQVNRLLGNKEEARELGERGFQVIQQHQGATEKNMRIINKFMQGTPRCKEKCAPRLVGIQTGK